MKKSKRAMRRLILSRLYDFLQDQYSIFYSREKFVSGELPLREIDALLAFKSDAQLEELRSALDRLDDGSYGICLGCKSVIEQNFLDADPTVRVCAVCERNLIHAAMDRVAHHHIHL